MKKSFMTRALATGLSLAMAFSLSAATNVSVASAAAKPAMKSTTMTVKVGQSKNYQATAATQKAYKITAIKMSAAGKTKATVKINSSKKSIKVTGKAATKGSNVIVTFKNNSTKKLTKVTTKVVVKDATPVDIATKIADVKQKTFTDFTVTMSKALDTVATSDFTMVRDNDNQVITVKAASLDATDKTKVNLTVYTSLTDAKTYTVTYTAADEAKTQSSKQVTVTDGTVANVAITPVEISVNQATLIEYQTLDANGVVVSQKGVTKPESKVDVTWDSLLGTMNNDNSNYILYNEGDTAKFTVTYHTYKYDTTTGAEVGVITKDFTVTAVKDASTITQYTYTIATSKPFDWTKVTPKQTLALDDDNRYAYFLIKDSKNSDVTGSCEYTVESSNNSIVVADGPVTGTKLSPVSKGSAFLMIKDKDGKVVHTLPITVGDKRTISTFKLSAPVVNIATQAAFTGGLDTNDVTCGYTEITAKDQYGDDIDITDLDFDNKTKNNVANVVRTTPTSKTVRVTGVSGGKKGYDNYILTATDKLGKSMTTSLRVNSIDASGTVTYSVVFLDQDSKVVTSVDTTVPEVGKLTATTDDKDLTAVVVKKQSGVVVAPASDFDIKSMKVTKNDGSVVANVVSGQAAKATSSAAISSPAALAATGTGITAAAAARFTAKVRPVTAGVNPLATKNLLVGTYTVVFEIVKPDGKDDKAAASFTVVDSQTAVTAKVKETNCGSVGGDVKAFLNNTDYVEFYYGEVKVSGTVTDVDAKKSSGSKNIYVKSATVTVPVADSGTDMVVSVPINKTFITTDTFWSN